VTSTKIHSGAITPGKLASKSFGGRILYFAEIANNGSVITSEPKGVKTEDWTLSSGGGLVTFPRAIPKRCFTLAEASAPSPTTGQPSSVSAGISTKTLVQVAAIAQTPVNLAIVCPR
jgi:hypothetical protein